MGTVDQDLSRLESSGLVRIAQLEPELEYLFRHVLVQEATYHSILKQDRKTLHQQVGEALERLYPDRIEELAAQLASHFSTSGDAARAVKYGTMAGNAALARYANAEAIMQFTLAIEAATDLPLDDTSFRDLYLQRGRGYELSGRYDEAVANYEALLKAAAERKSKLLELAGLMASATIYGTFTPHFNADKAIDICGRALKVSEELRDEAAQAKIHWNMLLAYRSSARMEPALEHAHESLRLARKLGLEEQIAFSLHDGFYPLLGSGDIETALKWAEESRGYWRKLGNKPMLADNLTATSELVASIGRIDEAVALTQEALEISRSINNVWGEAYALGTSGIFRLFGGKLGEAIKLLNEGGSLAEQGGAGFGVVLSNGMLGIIYNYLGDPASGIQFGEKSAAWAQKSMPLMAVLGTRVQAQSAAYQGDLARARQLLDSAPLGDQVPDPLTLATVEAFVAEITLLEGKAADSLAYVDRALASIPPIGTKGIITGNLKLIRAQALEQLKRFEESRDGYQQVVDTEINANINLLKWEAYAGLARIAGSLGDSGASALARQDALNALEAVISTVDQPELIASFCALPDVAEVLAWK